MPGHVLVLGGNGFIGSAIIAELLAQGIRVTGVARNPAEAKRLNPAAHWIAGDFNRDQRPEDWMPRLAGITAIVNAAGVLQDGGGDNLHAAHVAGPSALMAAAERAGIRRFIQISAAGAEPTAGTAFLATKGEGDARLMASSLEWVVLRPGLVLGRSTYGGTALLRAIATLPVLPVVRTRQPIQVVGVADIAEAVGFLLAEAAPVRQRLDLVHRRAYDLADILFRLRNWLGYPPAPLLAVPDGLAAIGCRAFDAISLLGWRPPMRTTTLDMLRLGVLGDAESWPRLSGRELRPLAALPDKAAATVQDRWHARLFLLRGLAIAVLAAFWLASGAIALARLGDAARILAAAGFSAAFATAFVAGTALLDLAIGALIALKRRHRLGLWLAIVTSMAYLVGGTFAVPQLWLDPLGPFVKVAPQILLAAMLLAVADER